MSRYVRTFHYRFIALNNIKYSIIISCKKKLFQIFCNLIFFKFFVNGEIFQYERISYYAFAHAAKMPILL